MIRRGLALVVGLAALGLSACGGSTTSSTPAPAAKLVHVDGSHVPSVELTPLGAQRIGIQTTPVAAVAHRGGARTVIPYGAVVYEPNGKPVVFVNTGRFVYRLTPITIANIAGSRVYVSRGPAVGKRVVTVGAEELLGVQNGVGVEA